MKDQKKFKVHLKCFSLFLVSIEENKVKYVSVLPNRKKSGYNVCNAEFKSDF